MTEFDEKNAHAHKPRKKPNPQKIVRKVKSTVVSAKEAVDERIQAIDVEQLVRDAMTLPGAKVNRSEYLKKQLRKYYPESMVEEAVRTNPIKAGVKKSGIEMIAKETINFETNQVSAVSALAGMPGGLVIAATMTADTIQYFVSMIRTAQKLAYLYGYPEMEIGSDVLDDGAMNELMIFLGVMFGVQGAEVALKKLAAVMAVNVEKQLARKALMKTTIYPIVKRMAKIIGVQMTKEIFAKGVSKTVPVVGGVVSGGLTFVTFKPCCKRLQKELEKNLISDIEYLGWD